MSDESRARENVIPRSTQSLPRRQGFDATIPLYYEKSFGDPEHLEVWAYTDRLSYPPGGRVDVHLCSTGSSVTIEIIRDGARPASIHRVEGVPTSFHPTPADFYATGCGWPVGYSFVLPDDLESGFYLVVVRAENDRGERQEYEHGFFVRPRRRSADIVLVAATCTWTAYNDWGGVNNYMGDLPEGGLQFGPKLTIHRPWARGFMWCPVGAPRKPHENETPVGAIPRYPTIEFSYARGFSKWYANAGWAMYERLFVVWAEQNGYALDYVTQLDLQDDPDLLNAYPCAVFVGHDEYWTWEMRDSVDRFVEAGGHVARFAGNFCWQIRLEDEGATQVCFKEFAGRLDPVVGAPDARRITSFWEDPAIGRPGAETFGLNALYGIYARVGGMAPRSTGGFTVYRPEHWALEGADLHYGDVFGQKALIFGYEVDGLDYTFADGVPVPTFKDGAPVGVQIIAMGVAANKEDTRGRKGAVSYYGDPSPGFASFRYGDTGEASVAAAARGSGMIVSFERGRGSVFHAGTTEWVAGLSRRDEITETITHNVLRRFTGMSEP